MLSLALEMTVCIAVTFLIGYVGGWTLFPALAGQIPDGVSKAVTGPVRVALDAINAPLSPLFVDYGTPAARPFEDVKPLGFVGTSWYDRYFTPSE